MPAAGVLQSPAGQKFVKRHVEGLFASFCCNFDVEFFKLLFYIVFTALPGDFLGCHHSNMHASDRQGTRSHMPKALHWCIKIHPC